MKITKTSLYIFALSALAFSACKEEAPYINYQIPTVTFDTTYIVSPVPNAQLKEVLIEDISGVGCVNCPEAAQIARGIVAANPGRVNVMTNYPDLPFGILVKPINHDEYQSKYDFRTEAGKDICNFVTVPGNLPAGYINRKKIAGDWSVPKDNWSGEVNAELGVTTPVNIELSQHYTPADKKLTVEVTLTYTAARTDSNYISIMLLQDSTIDVQETREQSSGNTIYDSVYVHQHALMDMLTSHNGDLLNNSSQKTLVAGRVIKIRYEKILDTRTNTIPGGTLPPPQWSPKHMKVLAIVTEGPTTKYVLQSKEIEVHE